MTTARPGHQSRGGVQDHFEHFSSGARGRLVVAAGVAGLLLGALVGGLLGGLRAPQWTATALVQIAPDPVPSALGVAAASPSDSQLTAFLQTQLIYLSSGGFRSTLEQQLGSGASLEVTQVQDAPVLQVVSQDPSGDLADQVVKVAVQQYTDYRRTRFTESLQAQATATQQQLDQAAEALDQLPTALEGDETSAAALQREAVQTQYTSLLTLNSAIATALQADGSVVTVLQESEVTPPAGLPPVQSGALGGAALGALLAVSAVVVLRRLSSRVGGLADVESFGIPVLAPEVPHGRPDDGLLDGAVQRVVAAQAPHLDGGRAGPLELVVVGPAPGVGTSHVAAHHASNAARRGPVVLVKVNDHADADLHEQLGISPDDAVLELNSAHVGLDDVELWVRSTTVAELYVITWGRDVASGTALLEQSLVRGLVDACRSAGWGVVVDAPALDRSSAGLIAARACGSSAVVVAAGLTGKTQLEQALAAFAAWQEIPDGIIVNRPSRRPAQESGLVRHGELWMPSTAARAGAR